MNHLVKERLMPYVYILKCSDASLYTGSTWDLERRLWEHQNGVGANHTKERLPVKLVFCEECSRIEDAFQREKQIQGWSHRKKLALIKNQTSLLPKLSANHTTKNSV
jgi:putative endonuclease